MQLQTKKVIRRVRPSDSVLVTEENLSAVAGWASGLVVPPGHLDNTTDKPYVHIPMQNPRKISDQHAHIGMYVVRENFRSFRIYNEKTFEKIFEDVNTSSTKTKGPSPASMPKRVNPNNPTQTGAQAVTPGTPPTDGSSLTTGLKADNSKETQVQDETPEVPEAVTAPTPAESAPPITQPTTGETPDPFDDAEVIELSPLPEGEVMHGDAMAAGDDSLTGAEDIGEQLENASGEVRDLEQAEETEDGMVALGQPDTSEADELEHEDVASDEPVDSKLCGQCGSATVDGVCSRNIEHNVDFVPNSEG